MRWVQVAGVVLALVLSACVGEAPEESGSQQGGLINGTLTWERPEVGRISGCTATLIRPNVVITAAHCVGFASREQAGSYGRFTVDIGPGVSRSFTIERMRSYSTGRLGERDVSLLRLAEAVPSSVATPTDISTRGADQGEPVTLFGYGCTDRRTNSGAFRKRKIAFDYQNSANLCPGDSGGPGVLGGDGPIFLVHSGYFGGSGQDIFGEPWRFEAELRGQIRRWDEIYGTPEPAGEVRVTNATGARLWVACNGRESGTCSGWQLLEEGASAFVRTRGRRLVLDNQDFLPEARMSRLEAVAPSDDATVFPNPASPFEPPNPDPAPAPEPEPAPDPPEDPEPEVAPEPPEDEPAPDPEPEHAPDPDPDPEPAPDPDQCQEEQGEPNDERIEATAIGLGAHEGNICGQDADWYFIQVQGRWRARADFDGGAGNIDLRAYSPNGSLSWLSRNHGNYELVEGVGSGYVQVYGAGGDTNSYTLTIY